MRPVRLITTALLTVCLSSCSSDQTTDEPVIPKGAIEQRDGFTIVWLHGTPYEMGYQHGTLLREQLREAAQVVLNEGLFKILKNAAKIAKLDEVALANSYPWLLEECKGMVKAVDDPDFQMFECVLINFGDVAVEFLNYGMPQFEDIAPGCSQVVATGSATSDGSLYHARVLDWYAVDFVVNNPVIFVRQPKDGIPHLFVGFPGNLSSYQGMNAEGIVVASNEVNPRDTTVNDLTGRSHVQMVVEILTHASSLDEARTIVKTSNHMSLETLVVSDGKQKTAEVFELAPAQVGVRPLKDDVVYATNHFVESNTADLDAEKPNKSTYLRWDRLTQLVTKDGAESKWGKLNPETLIAVMRDRVNPETGQPVPDDIVDNGESLATNGALYQVVFAPETLSLWVAAGKIPVPSQPFVGFNLGELLHREGYSTPATLP
ncbi:MAG TPA: C45 family autoproteolytic acyltransferase/hydrolase [Polyangiaceae bacterium]|nr:C45 family autoproteolytic acyltransferase/hydrolase [Polyangiaceae bacterium]HOD24342.1 C45 family autoproteolytic acyltransferase/hydrolase [Polyangiaceae bacterium]HOR37339.1 C45 family autoproteolytic acyltransferase/hydrolase [Polyangiaceae bacterium]HOT11690.1 C45 family autoproteolytic acyltransferase/hydrolase [Polyangiaceae bacterium]HPB96672.1 C45 family autoproteolytic acyltransferase/hydrolase [Polyangiaceae bacterium]